MFRRTKSTPALIAFAALIVTVSFMHGAWANNCGFPGPDQVIIYQHTNRGGTCQVLGIGNYPTSFGLPNDSISAIDVGPNVRAVMYQHGQFGGRQAHYDGGWYYDPLGNVNDRTSSIEVYAMQGGPTATYYLGNYPSNRENFWSNDSQGIANDGTNWFITTGYNTDNSRLFKIPFGYDLNSGSAPSPGIGIPSDLVNLGYNHFGDPDQRDGYLFIPLQGPERTPVVAVYWAADLRFLTYRELHGLPSGGGGWVAIRPGANTLWASPGTVDGSNPVREYDIEWDALRNRNVLDLRDSRTITLSDRDGWPVGMYTMQGGVFNPEGTLFYTTNGWCDSFGYIDVFFIDGDTGTLQASSENGYGPFNFETHPRMQDYTPWHSACGGDEAEGVDFLDVRGRGIHGIPDGQLHVIMIKNGTWGDDDNLYFKHYSF